MLTWPHGGTRGKVKGSLKSLDSSNATNDDEFRAACAELRVQLYFAPLAYKKSKILLQTRARVIRPCR